MNKRLIITLVSNRSSVLDIHVRMIVKDMERLDHLFFKDQFIREFKDRLKEIKVKNSKVQPIDLFGIIDNDGVLEIWKYKMNRDPNYKLYRIGGLL